MIRIKRKDPLANVFNLLGMLRTYRSGLNRKRIATTRIDKFLDEKQYESMKYDEVCKKIKELTHGYITVEQ